MHIAWSENVLADSLSKLYSINELEINNVRAAVEKIHSVGHYGANNLVKLLKLRGIKFPKMKEYCKQVIQNCGLCQNWSNSIPQFSPINPVFVDGVWERIAIALIGPMPNNDEEFAYILAIVDAATRYVVVQPIHDKTAR